MPEEQQQLYDKIQKAEVALVQSEELSEKHRKEAVNGMLVAIGVTKENEELYKDTIACGEELLEVLWDRGVAKI